MRERKGGPLYRLIRFLCRPLGYAPVPLGALARDRAELTRVKEALLQARSKNTTLRDLLGQSRSTNSALQLREQQLLAEVSQLHRERKALAKRLKATRPLSGLVPELRVRARDIDFAARLTIRAGARALKSPDQPGRWPRLGGSPNAAAGVDLAAPIQVLLGGDGATLFDLLDDPRITIARLGDEPSPSPDVLVLPRAELENLGAFSQSVPAAVWDKVARGATKLVFDASREGYPHDAERSRRLNRFLIDKGAQPRDAVYLTQDRQYEDDYRSECNGAGIQPMHVWVWDYFIQDLFGHDEAAGAVAYEAALSKFVNRDRRRSHRFLSLNYTPRPTRLLFLLRVLRDRLWDQGRISFGGFVADHRAKFVTPTSALKDIGQTPGFEDLARDLAPWIEALDAKGSILFSVEFGNQKLQQAQPLEEYDDTWFSVVAETEMSPRLHRITEKPFKPLLNFHPAILLGSPGSLGLLRAYGFQTFGDFFDESYDDEPDPRRRFDMVYEQVVRLCQIDETELARREAGLADVLAFNARWGLIELPRLFKDQIEADFVSRLVDLVRGPS
jgi:hypothetical protein